MVIREPLETLDLNRQEHTWVSRIKLLGRDTVTREKQEPGIRTRPEGRVGAAVSNQNAG